MKNNYFSHLWVQGAKICQRKSYSYRRCFAHFGYLKFYRGALRIPPNFSQHFEKNEKNQFFTPVGAGGNQWVQNTENVFFEKVYLVIVNNFDHLCHFAGMSQSREIGGKPSFYTCFDTW